jgi:hypothetical protein
MHIVIGISLGFIVSCAVIVWMIIGIWQRARKKKRLAILRVKQEAARLKALERAMRRPLWKRLMRVG